MITIAFHSQNGHTEVLGQSILEGINTVKGVKGLLIDVNTETLNWEPLNNADAIIFGSPTYMGNVSGIFKTFMDGSSPIWYQRKWINKLAGGFTSSGSLSGDKLNTLQSMCLFAAQHGMVWIGPSEICTEFDTQPHHINRLGSNLGIMSQCNPYEDRALSPPSGDRETTKLYGARMAKSVLQWQAPTSTQQKETEQNGTKEMT